MFRLSMGAVSGGDQEEYYSSYLLCLCCPPSLPLALPVAFPTSVCVTDNLKKETGVKKEGIANQKKA